MTDIQQGPMPKVYDHRTVEERLYDFWERKGYFTPQIDWSKTPFTIVMPPPNVTGELHYGHAMFVTFEDLMVRWRRMQGYPTLWLPGTDHAGIATQNVVENELAKQGLTRHDLGREKFEQRVWEWKQKYGGVITHQLRRLGASCDWTRERFTLDEGLSRAVRETFVRLYNEGLIYRGEYMINWCPRCGTALSDLEVEHEEVHSKLYYVRYPLLRADGRGESGEFISVATTRPETILGDTAVAVNPDDQRYKDLVGRTAILPVLGRHIPIIADPAVDPAFGTGAVKVTPSHDPTDYEIAQRHQLPFVTVIAPDGRMTAEAGPYAGLDRFEARRKLLDELKASGLLTKVDDYVHSVGQCDRCGAVIEPLISRQWFVRIKPLADAALAAVRDGRITIVPERFAKVYFNWMENIRDWCISRQLWWGHRIPVWYCSCGEIIVSVETPAKCPVCQNQQLIQESDVLDTWFSSGLWPFSTLGWPEDTEDLRYFYPTSVMETGYDIIFFWVARMIMLGLECTGEVPFRYVYLHGLLRDEKGEKMSKSKGNVANPLDVIAQYGADALRFTIITGSTPGNDMKLVEDRVASSRNFANKLWNTARFVLGVISTETKPVENLADLDRSRLTLAERWALSRFARLNDNVTKLMEEFQFGEAGRQLYDFLWGEYADWLIEVSKIRLYSTMADADKESTRQVLLTVLNRLLRLLHPFLPFVTEEIWQHLPGSTESIMVSPWPSPELSLVDAKAESDMETVIEVIRSIRNARAEFGVEAGRRIAAIIVTDAQYDVVRLQEPAIKSLARVEPLEVWHELAERPKQAVHAVANGVEVYLPLAGLVDLEAEKARLEKEIASVAQNVSRLEARLSNESFVSRAPAEVVQRERDRLEEERDRLAKLEARLGVITGQ
ncbi:MAG: valine--tRNA ligase [Chloroflexota bacterium]